MPRPAVPRRWINGTAFGTRVLRGGENPWRVPEELGLFQRELSALLTLELVDIDIEPALEAFTAAMPMAIDRDDSTALESLLGGSDLAAFLSRGIEAVTGAMGDVALALSLPGPDRLARLFLSDETIDEDVLDDLSLALTALLRSIFKPGIGFLRISENGSCALEFLSPLTNLATHYECTSILVLTGEAASSTGAHGFDFVYRERLPAVDEGALLPMAYWLESGEIPSAPSLYVEVPANGIPETVLAKLADLAERAA